MSTPARSADEVGARARAAARTRRNAADAPERDRERPEPAEGAAPRKKAKRAALSREPRPGAPPGTLVVHSSERPDVFVMDFDSQVVIERKLDAIEECVEYLTDDRPSITWVDVRGLGHKPTFERLGDIFGLHPLALEDMVNAPQRPKSDTYPNHQLVILRMARILEGELKTEQIAIAFGESFVLTVQERPDGDVLEPVRQRIRRARGPLRISKADYLAYALIDAVVDGFFPVLERLSEELDDLELRSTDPSAEVSRPLHEKKRELLALRRAIWPQRDMLNSLLRDDSPHVRAETRVYLRDTYDHAVQVMDMVETNRELASGIMDLYFSSVSNRTNDIMRVLTILSSIFLPITFIAGVYGMNFDVMPELRWKYGYPVALLGMGCAVAALLVYYRRRGWLGGDDLK